MRPRPSPRTAARVPGAAACTLAAAGALLGLASPAAADPLTPAQQALLARGETLVFDKTVVNDTHRYVGGVTYTIVDATTDEVGDLLQDTNAYRAVLPRTKDVRVVTPPGPPTAVIPTGLGRDFFVELRQGTALMETVYTLHVRKVDETRTVQFWMDPRMPHGIDDAWGFFRYQPMPEATGRPPSVLFTYGILVDVGPGLVRELFEEKVRAVLLSVPQRVRSYVRESVKPLRLAKKT